MIGLNVDINAKPYIQITRPFLKWLLPFFAVLSGSIAAFGGIPTGMGLAQLFLTLFLFCPVMQGICIRVTNDIFDVDVDRLSPTDEYARFRPIASGIISRGQGGLYAGMGYMIALIISYALGPVIFTIAILTLIAQFIYSAPPLRLKKVFPVNNVLIGAFYCGAFFIAGWSLFQPINIVVINIAILLTLYGTIASMSKDYSDVDGDGSKGIMTMPVIMGLKKSGRVHVYLIIAFFLLVGLFILLNLLPIHSLLVFISLPFFIPSIRKLLNMNAKTSIKERTKVMGMIITTSFLVMILLGISIAISLPKGVV